MQPKMPLPPLRSDQEAERFVDEADLSEYDLSGARLMRFHFTDQPRRDLRLSLTEAVVERAKKAAEARSEPLDRFLEDIIERALEPSA